MASTGLVQLLILLAAGLLLICMQPAASARDVLQGAAPDIRTNIDVIVIGDSTAANYTLAPQLYPLSGWAMFLQHHFNQSAAAVVAVRDLAAPGRSSMSFYHEKLWQQAKSQYLSAGDYVFIQFGHNDQKADLNRHTDPFTTFKHYLTIYIDDTRAAMAIPVLVTSISRALWETDGSGFKQSLGNYPIAMRQLAQELHVPLIDLNEDTAALFTELGEQTTQNDLFMCLPAGKYPNYPDGIHDTTHLQEEGAKRVAALAAHGIVAANLPLQAYLLN